MELKPSRQDLCQEICKLANLPDSPEKDTEGYFTKEQLIYLLLHVTRQNQIIAELRGGVNELKTI